MSATAAGRHARLRTPGRLSVEHLLAELERMPARQAVAVRVLHVADDPTSSAHQLAAAVSLDPVLTAQVMRLANSTYYGLSGRVRSADFAVTVLGFATIRSLAAAFAAGALGGEASTPPEFWFHAAATAAGTAFVSGRLGVARTDAFSLGLLHDLGSALLHRVDPHHAPRHDEDPAEGRAGLAEERQVFGTDHARAGAAVLSGWRFPTEIVAAIAAHHEAPAPDLPPLSRALAGGQALAVLSRFGDGDRDEFDQRLTRLETELRVARLDPSAAWEVTRSVRAEAAAVAASFSVA